MADALEHWRKFPAEESKKLSFLYAFGRDCKLCGGAIGALYSIGKPSFNYNIKKCKSNQEMMFNGEECPYCSAHGNTNLKVYENIKKTLDVFKKQKFSADTVAYVMECRQHGLILILIKARNNIGFAEIRQKLLGHKIKLIPRYETFLCPFCGQQCRGILSDITALRNTPLPLLFSVRTFVGGVLAERKYEKIDSHLLHPGDEAIVYAASDILHESTKLHKSGIPKIAAIRQWMKTNIRAGMIVGLSKGKLVRSDLEILKDREANWIEYCILFYALAENLGVECAFGVYEDIGEFDDYKDIAYLLFAREGKTTVAILPWATFCNRACKPNIKGDIEMKLEELSHTPNETIDIKEFLCRVHMLSKLNIFSLMHTTPLLYYANFSSIWLYSPKPNVLSQVVKNGAKQIFELRYVMEKDPESQKMIANCTYIDFERKQILTNSREEAKHYSKKKLKDFQIVRPMNAETILTLTKKRMETTKMMGNEFCSIFFGKNMKKIIEDFKKEVERHYNPAYA